MSSVGELSAVPLNQERGHTHKERRVSIDRKRDRKEMAVLEQRQLFQRNKVVKNTQKVKTHTTKVQLNSSEQQVKVIPFPEERVLNRY